MTDPIPVNLSSIQQRAAQKEAKQLSAKQEAAQSRFEENVERGFNPEAADREQGRYQRFRTLESRKKHVEEVKEEIESVEAKTEEDLAQNYFRRNPELPPDRLRQLRDSLNPEQTAEEILRSVIEMFEDATLVDETLEYLERSTSGSLRGNVSRARALHQEQKGREIAAGRNVDSAAKFYHKKGIGANETALRDLYRDITGNPRNHNQLFTELSNSYPFDQLKLVVAFLLKGLSFDLKSKGPSIQEPELMRLMTEARNLQSILWVYMFFKSRLRMIRSLYSRYGMTYPETLSFEKLAKGFISFVEESYPSVLKLFKLAQQLNLDEELEKIIVFSQYRDAIRQLSPRLYKTLRHRENLLLIIYESMEELEDRIEGVEEEE